MIMESKDLIDKQTELLFEVRIVAFTLRENQLQALLRPANTIYTPVWELPGDFISATQSLEETATQCLYNYTGIQEAYVEQLYTYGELNRCAENRVVSVVYFSLIPSDFQFVYSLNDQHPKWFPIDHLPALNLDHEEILRYALRRLRYKLEYSAVGFELLPDTFSLSELQHTYELILGEKLDKRNFRRRILEAGIIEPTSMRRMGEGRPPQLYRYRPDAVAEVKARRLFP